MSHAILDVHALSRYDTTTSFVRPGKLSLKSKLEKFITILTSLVTSSTITDTLLTGLGEFVSCLYSNEEYTNINKLYFILLSQKFSPTIAFSLSNIQGVNLNLLPQTSKKSLENRIKSVNYECYLLDNALS